MENLKKMKECLTGMVEGQIYGNIDKVDAQELGAAVDMIKDLSEAIYYCTITQSMEEGSGKERSKHGTMYYPSSPVEYYDPRYRSGSMYTSRIMPEPRYHDGTYRNGEMMPSYESPSRPQSMNEGRSGQRRKMYMEGKGLRDKTKQMQELDAYMQELANDMTEMIHDASPEEKTFLQQKIATLASKIK